MAAGLAPDQVLRDRSTDGNTDTRLPDPDRHRRCHRDCVDRAQVLGVDIYVGTSCKCRVDDSATRDIGGGVRLDDVFAVGTCASNRRTGFAKACRKSSRAGDSVDRADLDVKARTDPRNNRESAAKAVDQHPAVAGLGGRESQICKVVDVVADQLTIDLGVQEADELAHNPLVVGNICRLDCSVIGIQGFCRQIIQCACSDIDIIKGRIRRVCGAIKVEALRRCGLGLDLDTICACRRQRCADDAGGNVIGHFVEGQRDTNGNRGRSLARNSSTDRCSPDERVDCA